MKGKVVLVTGGGTGIGAAIARLFTKEGAQVLLCGRRKEPLERLGDDISAAIAIADISKESEVRAMLARCEQQFGRLDVLVNNAGIAGPTVSIVDQDVEVWDEVFATNLRGAMLCMKHSIPLMKRQGGAIINIASDALLRPKPKRGCYASSKWALVALTKSVALEVGIHGIRVNALVPGATQTQMLTGLFDEWAEQRGIDASSIEEQMKAGSALHAIAQPQDIAEAALYLARARAVTSTTLVVDCGQQ